MQEKISDLIYATRSLCEALQDRNDLLDEELRDFLEETQGCLDKLSEDEDEEDLD